MMKNVDHHESCGAFSAINCKLCFEPVRFRDSQDKGLCPQLPPASLPWQPASLLGPGGLVACLSMDSQLLRGGLISRKPLRLEKAWPLLSPQSVWVPQAVSLLPGSVGLPAALPSSFWAERLVHDDSVKLSADA